MITYYNVTTVQPYNEANERLLPLSLPLPLPIFPKYTNSILLQTYGNVLAWPVSDCIKQYVYCHWPRESILLQDPLAILHYKPPVLSCISFLLAQVSMFIFQFYAMRIIV